MKYFTNVESPLGTILLVSNGSSLIGLYFVGQKYVAHPAEDWIQSAVTQPFPEAKRQLTEYFAGERRNFDLPLTFEGTPFQQRVWHAIAAIPCGVTISYSALARSAGAPGSARAAGAATGRNPISLVVPCHRVVGSDGALTGYAGGLDRKRRLLTLESSDQGSVDTLRLTAKFQGQLGFRDSQKQ
jgi:methylated-DNA-[protein]-cysteine S-methyltransferase